jgi:hypothetical protein
MFRRFAGEKGGVSSGSSPAPFEHPFSRLIRVAWVLISTSGHRAKEAA